MEGTQIPTPHRSADGKTKPSRSALDLLRERVQRAIDTIGRLRAENRTLRQRVRELENRPAVDEDQTVLLLDNPDALRDQIERFIETIDTYLAETDTTAASDDVNE